jgi:hypothetical protein
MSAAFFANANTAVGVAGAGIANALAIGGIEENSRPGISAWLPLAGLRALRSPAR